MKFAVASATCLLALAMAAGAVGAETLNDPTRPPAAFEVGGAGSMDAAPVGLQSIIRRSPGKAAAIINGEYVELGGQVGDARLVKIGEDFVMLKGATGTETLRLIPAVEKTPAKNAAGGLDGKGAAASGKRVTK